MTESVQETEIAQLVEQQLAKRRSGIRNRAAIGAMVKILPVVGEGLHHALTAGTAAVKDEKRDLQLELLCQLVEKIDAAISEMIDQAKARGAPFDLGGNFNVRAEHVETVTGIDVAGRSGTIQPGTVVNVDAKHGKTVTGVKL